MDTLRLILLFVHMLGFAALIGGLLAQRGTTKRINAAVRDGAGLAFVAGLGLVGVLEANDADVNHAKIAVKLVISLVVLVLVMANVRKERISQNLWALLLVLSIANVAVALFWSATHA